MNFYTRTDWVTFRESVIKMDGGKCLSCSRTRADGAILQVHHKRYIAGRKPWEYDYDDCETLCRGCHAAEHGKVTPKRDWECIGHVDLGDLIGNCELCGTKLRYLYLIHHPNWPAMEVGTDCCDSLTESLAASEHLERHKKHADKMKRFASSPRWKQSSPDELNITQHGINVSVHPRDEGYYVIMDGVNGISEFPTVLDAKIHIFELINSGEAEKFLATRIDRNNPRNK